MGSALSATAKEVSVPSEYLTALPSHTLEENLRTTRFLKTVRTSYKSTMKVVKVFVKQDSSMNLSAFEAEVIRVRTELRENTNAQAVQQTLENEKAGILVRPYFYSNLFDRISTRPLLNLDEKRWIAFQLFHALAMSHSKNVCHGDIKIDNVLLTSWNWVYLSDYATFKPTHLPADNPAAFSYFFDISGRRTCGIAPERFYKTEMGGDPESCRFDGKVTPAMDIFSLGCVIYEMMTDGKHLYDLSLLLDFRAGKLDPSALLDKITDLEIRALVLHMTNLDPSKRSSARQYLDDFRGKVFPSAFSELLHGYMIGYVSGEALTPDQKIMRLLADFDTLSAGFEASKADSDLDQNTSCYVIVGSLVTACWRSLAATSAKLAALELLQKISLQVEDEYKLDRYVPFVIASLSDRVALVRASALRTLTRIVEPVQVVRANDLNLFPSYIFPNVSSCKSDAEVSVRVAYAESIAILAKTAQRFLELAQLQSIAAADAEAEAPTDDNAIQSYDVELTALQNIIQSELVTIMTDEESFVKQTLLGNNLTQLCTFFGPQKVEEALLCHMFTFFNEKKDWRLRLAFFKSIVAVATYCGSQSIERQVLPFIEKCLSDSEEYVVEQTITTITALVELQLFRKPLVVKMVADTVPLLYHPGLWIRHATVALVAAVARFLSPIDVYATLIPRLEPFFSPLVLEMTDETLLLDALKPEIPRNVYEAVVNAEDVSVVYDALLQRAVTPADKRSASGTRMALSTQHEKWIARLEGMGMTAEVEEKLLTMEEYVQKVFRERKRLAAEDDGGAERAMMNKVIGVGSIGMDMASAKGVLLADPQMGIPPSEKAALAAGEKPKKKKSKADAAAAAAEAATPSMTGGPPTPASSSSSMSASASASGGGGGGGGKPASGVQSRNGGGSGSGGFGGGESNSGGGGEAASFDGRNGGGGDSSSNNGSGASLAPGSPSKSSRSRGGKLKGSGGGGPIGPFDKYQQNVRSLLLQRRQAMNAAVLNQPAHVPFKSTLNMKGSMKKKAKAAMLERDRDAQNLREWRPAGQMVGHFLEHKAPINTVVVMPDQRYFLTGSDDRSVRMWDCSLLDGKVVSNRSQLQYAKQAGKVKHVSVCNGGRLVASGADNGTIHLFQVENPSATLRERVVPLDTEGQIVSMQAVSSNSPVLTFATVRGTVQGWDTRTSADGWKLQAFPSHGLIQSCTVDPGESWMTVGTSRGVYTLWDLRFRIPIKSWLHPGEARIHSVCKFPEVAAPMHGGSPAWDPKSWLVSAAGNNSAMIWDARTSQVVTRFNATPYNSADADGLVQPPTMPRVASVDSKAVGRPGDLKPPRSAFAFYQLAVHRQKRGKVDRAMQQAMEARWKQMTPLDKEQFVREEADDALRYQDELTTCLAGPWEGGSTSGGTTASSTVVRDQSLGFTAVHTHQANSAVYLGSADGRIRVWDLDRPQDSFILGERRQRGETPSRASVTSSYEVGMHGHELRVRETLGKDVRAQIANAASPPSGHATEVTGIALLTAPDKMLISTSRDGVVKLWR